jgi:hypothetical protein
MALNASSMLRDYVTVSQFGIVIPSADARDLRFLAALEMTGKGKHDVSIIATQSLRDEARRLP